MALILDFTAPCWVLTATFGAERTTHYVNPARVLRATVVGDRLRLLFDSFACDYDMPEGGVVAGEWPVECVTQSIAYDQDFKVGGTD
jgi:hypothetical protein